jgi:hypothetical protein
VHQLSQSLAFEVPLPQPEVNEKVLRSIASPNDIIILGAMMENDSSSPDSVVSAVDGILAAKLQI